MGRRLARFRLGPAVTGVLLAFVVFSLWQFVDHWLLAERFRLPLLAEYSVDDLVETACASVVIAFVIRALAGRNRELAELSRQKDTLTDFLVHDLRQPITALLAGLSVARAARLPPQAKASIQIAEQGGAELLGMVDDLLDITRLEAGQPLIEKAAVFPAEFIEVAVRDAEQLARQKEIDLRLGLAQNLPRIAGDRQRLGRVVMNLLSNAVQYTPEKGRVQVCARLDAGSARVLVSVSDNGIGIPKQFQQRIFDKFVVIETRLSAGRGSTGLGLAFCKMIVEAHGGTIWLESEEGQGSTFTFALPVSGGA